MPRKLTKEEFLAKAYQAHGCRYDYSQVEYTNNHTKVIIICKEHGEFRQRPNGHIDQRQGCPKCAGLSFTLEERFWSFIEKGESCWKWKGSKNRCGYGMIGEGRKVVYAHDLSYRLHYGEIPATDNYLGRMYILHKCDNPECTNPEHLFAGTQTDNMRDMSSKGRSTSGEKSYSAKLTWEDAKKIREMWKSGQYTQRLLSEMFDIDRSSISNIVNNKQWKIPNAHI